MHLAALQPALTRRSGADDGSDVGTRSGASSPAPVLGAGLRASYCPEHQ